MTNPDLGDGVAMRESTLEYIEQRARQSGLDPSILGLTNRIGAGVLFEIFVTYNGKDDEIVNLTDGQYAVNICDWIAENVAVEATIEGGIDSEPHFWKVELFPRGWFETDAPLYRRDEDEYGAVLCSANAGGDPASGCDNLVTGHDMLCTECRAAYHKMMQASKEEE